MDESIENHHFKPQFQRQKSILSSAKRVKEKEKQGEKKGKNRMEREKGKRNKGEKIKKDGGSFSKHLKNIHP